jgi:hypothetical protein
LVTPSTPLLTASQSRRGWPACAAHDEVGNAGCESKHLFRSRPYRQQDFEATLGDRRIAAGPPFTEASRM